MPAEVGDVIRATAVLKQSGTDDLVNVYHVRITTDPGASNDDECVEDISNILELAYGHLNGSLPTSLVYDHIDFQNITKNEEMPSVNWASLGTGGGAADAPSPQVASLVVYKVGIPGVQGRKYLPCFTEGLLDEGAITAGGVALLDGFVVRTVGIKVGGNGWQIEFGIRREGDGSFHPYISGRPIPFTRTQRRRTRGRGS